MTVRVIWNNDMTNLDHPTTRRGTLVLLGFGGVSLYGLWANYGAAPGPRDLIAALAGDADAHDASADAAHAAHGGTASTDAISDFRGRLDAFVARFEQPDGSVLPGVDPASDATEHTAPAPDHSAPAPEHSGHPTAHSAPASGHSAHTTGHSAPATDHAAHAPEGSAHATHAEPAKPSPASVAATDHSAHGAHSPAPATDADAAQVLDVYLLAERWYFEPAHLRLERGRPYRFRMMAADVAHGASISLGRGSRMVRLRPGVETELVATFPEPGRYLVYCTVYCAGGHDRMQARIDVA